MIYKNTKNERMMGPDSYIIINELLENKATDEKIRILDLGCGKGLTSIYMAEKYNIDEYESANRANQRIENSAMGQLESSILGYSNVTLASSQISLLNGRVKYALLPVWFLITTYHNQQYIFAMNGQTGKFVGDLPVDKSLLVKKFLLLFVLLLVVISALLLLI